MTEYHKIDTDTTYPSNLVHDIIDWSDEYISGKNSEPIHIDPNDFPSDFDGTLAYLLYRLNDRAKYMIFERYQENLTYQKIVAKHNLTRERVRQIINSSLRKLAVRGGAQMLQKGLHAYYISRILDSNPENIAKDAFLRGWNAALKALDENDEIPPKPAAIDKSPSIQALGFSARTYNALHHANIDTVQALLDADADAIIKIRNIGVKCRHEIYNTLVYLGYDVSNKEGLLI